MFFIAVRSSSAFLTFSAFSSVFEVYFPLDHGVKGMLIPSIADQKSFLVMAMSLYMKRTIRSGKYSFFESESSDLFISMLKFIAFSSGRDSRARGRICSNVQRGI